MSKSYGPKKSDCTPADLTPEEIATFEEYPDVERPKTRGDCWDFKEWKPIGTRPCPFVSCRYNLYLWVTRNGTIMLEHPDKQPEEMPANASCALDIEAMHFDANGEPPEPQFIARSMGITLSGVLAESAKAQENARKIRSRLFKVIQ